MEANHTDWRERVKVLRERMRIPPAVCTERGLLITESYKETEGEWPAVRQAKALAKIMSEMTVRIGDGELIVGNATSKQRGGAILPELSAQWLVEEMDKFPDRPWDRFAPLTEEEKSRIKEFLPYWRGRSLSDLWRARMPVDRQGFLFNGVMGGTVMCVNGHYAGHTAVDMRRCSE